MKKILAVLLILALLLSLAACGGQTKETSAVNPSSATASTVEATPTPEPSAEPTPEPTAEPTPTPAAKPGDQDILTEKMWLVAGEHASENFFPSWLDTERGIFSYEDRGVGKVVDKHGNIVLETSRWSLRLVQPTWYPVGEGYARFSYREKGAAQEPQNQDEFESLYNTYLEFNNGMDVYVAVYDFDGNYVRESSVEYDNEDTLYSVSPKREDGIVWPLNKSEGYSISPVSDDSLLIEPIDDGFLVKTKDGEELGHIVYEARGENECFATSMGNVITVWEVSTEDYYGEEELFYNGQRIYWVDIDLEN